MLGESLFNQKDYLGAITAYRQVLEGRRKERLEDQVFLRLGYAYFYTKNYDEAIQYWERFLSDFPDPPEKNEILYWMAEASLLKQDYRKGVGYVDRLKGGPCFIPQRVKQSGLVPFSKARVEGGQSVFSEVVRRISSISIHSFHLPDGGRVLFESERLSTGQNTFEHV